MSTESGAYAPVMENGADSMQVRNVTPILLLIYIYIYIYIYMMHHDTRLCSTSGIVLAAGQWRGLVHSMGASDRALTGTAPVLSVLPRRMPQQGARSSSTESLLTGLWCVHGSSTAGSYFLPPHPPVACHSPLVLLRQYTLLCTPWPLLAVC